MAQAIAWLEGLDPEAELAVTARFPELGGWEATSWAVEPGDADGSPSLAISVRGGDFDYGEPSRALLRALPPLPGEPEEADALGQLWESQRSAVPDGSRRRGPTETEKLRLPKPKEGRYQFR